MFALMPQSRPQSSSASNMAAEGAILYVVGPLLCSRDLDKKSSVQTSSATRMVNKNSKDIFKRQENLQKFSSLEAIEVFLRLMLFFLCDCVKNVPFYSRLFGLKENFQFDKCKTQMGFCSVGGRRNVRRLCQSRRYDNFKSLCIDAHLCTV